MANCVQCVEFDDCPWRSDPDAMCSAFKRKPMTNADRIRAMSDEELAKFFTDDLCELLCGSPLVCDGQCESAMLEWLKQEAET